jgi:hypothetical protein
VRVVTVTHAGDPSLFYGSISPDQTNSRVRVEGLNDKLLFPRQGFGRQRSIDWHSLNEWRIERYVIRFNGFAAIIFPAQDVSTFSFRPLKFDCFNHNHSIFLEIDSFLAKPGTRIMLIQLVCGLLSCISITLLKAADGMFARAIHLGDLLAVASFLPYEKFSEKSMLL